MLTNAEATQAVLALIFGAALAGFLWESLGVLDTWLQRRKEGSQRRQDRWPPPSNRSGR